MDARPAPGAAAGFKARRPARGGMPSRAVCVRALSSRRDSHDCDRPVARRCAKAPVHPETRAPPGKAGLGAQTAVSHWAAI